ncbi:T9SS type A sorting domain-containing protein [Oceanihabitans sediminis]|uniref:T9SS type A sorting domain-containing protein n=1 Tax=Oceanihabitans sediminis TaxID=1812012 RepID=UPI00299D839E|nr:T9SS type A sorting domain-containing protein [Oceanihabitans sediminis]MDX1277368.1 T9SS type A sorting domain-containing protein [Oceanihabitans sediminis]MDX1773022.1 T9SS type A sorting domain-containing protein [Oceanihabitans sediminis]
MKNFYTLLLCIVITCQIHAQYTLIPDPIFEQHLIDQAIDSEGTLDGQVLTSDLAIVNNLDISYLNITDLTGIQDFTVLTHLNASQTRIINLDLSGLTTLQDLNLFASWSIDTLNLTGCTGLTDLDLRLTSLNSLDLSTCSALTNLDFYKGNNIQDLDLQGLSSLVRVDVSESSLHTINLTGCTSLQYINISETSIASLDIIDNPVINNVGLYDCNIQNLNLENCPNLEKLTLSLCLSFNELSISNCNSFKNLTLNHVDLSNFDFSGLAGLESLTVQESTVLDIDLSNSPNLHTLILHYSGTNSLDLRNGNNINLSNFNVITTNLTCVNVDNEVYSTANWDNDNNSFIFSEDCELINTINNKLSNVNIYPNPVVHTLYIDIENKQQLQDVSIINMEGKELLISTENEIDLSSLSSGIYFAVMNINQNKIVKKILKH